jgi:serine/threonine protein kinase
MFLVLELVHGGELFDLISSNTTHIPSVDRIPEGFTAAETTMAKFFAELASGIHYCHANHMAHRRLGSRRIGSCTTMTTDHAR